MFAYVRLRCSPTYVYDVRLLTSTMFAYLRLRCSHTYVYDVRLLTSTMFAYLRLRCSSTYAYILRLRAVLDKVILATLGWDDLHRLLESTVSRYLQWQVRNCHCDDGHRDDFVDILLAYMIHSQFKCSFHLLYYMNYNDYIPSWLLAMYLILYEQ
jgi:hypothetical protein